MRLRELLFNLIALVATHTERSECNPSEESAEEVLDGAQLLAEVEAAFEGGLVRAGIGAQHDAILARCREALRPTFIALPKTRGGRVGHAAARHALYRFFRHEYGWVVKGLEPRGLLSGSPLMPVFFEEEAPAAVLDIFARRFETGRGWNLDDLAVFAATLEHVIHSDTVRRLEDTYLARRLPLDAMVSRAQAQDIAELHMASFIRGRNISKWNPDQAKRLQENIFHLYPGWGGTRRLLRDVQSRLAPRVNDLSFSDVAKMVLEIGDRFPNWNEEQCRSVKAALVAKDLAGIGRVPLRDFYLAAFHKKRYQFTDTESTLRRLRILDETDKKAPSVIIPNYMLGQSNCVAKTSHYELCCPHECESIVRRLEQGLGKAVATAEEVLDVLDAPVKSIPTVQDPIMPVSSTTPISDALRGDIRELATSGGHINLYGMAFARWLHKAYPHECINPHLSTMETELDDLSDGSRVKV
eukprot:TRINITY_DN74124_c0_g1_i1.p1 TRINITY_DN74124_c0_g1~~TRINITY_DN74124_c0_g1_i1.p1  ORF type:complete len:470 (-),score=51.28 TRINITY_DN74124_c0_g1_i1:99-1508(-)